MTDPLDDSPIVAHERGFRRELIGLLLLLVGVIAIVRGAWAFDWRTGLIALGALLVGGGLLLGIEGS